MRESVTTPVGVAKYCWLSKPDTAFNSENWKVSLVLSKDAAKPLISKIEKVRKAWVTEQKQQNKKVKEAPPPYKPDVDENGDPTGHMVFPFSSKVSVKPRIPMFDAKGKPMKNAEVWNGSQMKVNGLLFPYVAANGVGISLKLNAVQILELVTGGKGSAGGFGFEEEEGYEHADEEGFEENEAEEDIDSEGDF